MDRRDLRLLCLDGGGVRGLASLYVLQRFLATIGDPLPCRFFDMIAGTSTGGLIAIMLGRLEMTIDQCIDAYTDMMDEVFRRREKAFFPRKGSPLRMLAAWKVQPQYSSDVLKACIQRTIEQAGLHRDSLMREPKTSTCKTFVVALDESSKKSVQFTDYPRIGELRIYKDVKIWEAALATSAVPTFFDPITIGSRIFLDGALGFNNPVSQLWQQTGEQFPGSVPLEARIGCLMSVGTGRPPAEHFGSSLSAVAESIRKMAMQTETTAAQFYEAHTGLVERRAYYRLNPADIDVLADSPEEKGTIEGRTEAWLETPDVKRALTEFQQTVGVQPSGSSPAGAAWHELASPPAAAWH